MRPVPDTARAPNGRHRKSGREYCRWCDDTGYVVVFLRKHKQIRFRAMNGRPVACALQSGGENPAEIAGELEFEELGPCPYCEQGAAEEKEVFGEFWKGKPTGELKPYRDGAPKYLPREENKRRSHELLSKLQAGFEEKTP